jgi:quercetin dioxygenase-like cupin family protein
MILRLYTGNDGQTHFEEITLPQTERHSVALKAGADMTFRQSPEGAFSDWHNAPRRQYVIILSGGMEIGTGDGSKRSLGPGDIVLADDLTGQGHTTATVNGPRLTVSIPLPD